MGAESPLVADPVQLRDEAAVFDAPLADPHLKRVRLRVPQVHVADILEDRLPRGRLLVAEDEMARVERHAKAGHVAAERRRRLRVLRHPLGGGLHAHHGAESRGDRHHLAQPFDLAVERRAEFRRFDDDRHDPERFGEPAGGLEAVVELG